MTSSSAMSHPQAQPRSTGAPLIRIALDIAPYQLSDPERKQIEDAIGPASLASMDRAARDADVLLTQHVPDDIATWPNLKLIQLIAAGIDHLENHTVWQSSIPVTTASGIGHVSIAQYCLAMILNHYHRLPQAMRFGETRVWPDRLKLASRSLRDQAACIYGYGSIGRECGRLLRALGVEVLAVNRSGQASRDDDYNAWPGTGDPEGAIPVAWYAREQLSEAIARSQILVVTAPASASTRGSVDAKMLAGMPPGGLVVIVSRGVIVDETALGNALASGQLGGAIVDTFAKEPPSADHPLFGKPNVLLTPHISGVFDDYMGRIWPLLIENVRRVRAGQRPLNRVEPNLTRGGNYDRSQALPSNCPDHHRMCHF